jgi:HlyD family secretion protein
VITASGTVVPELEQVVSSPVEARVLRVRKRAGDPVARGETIVELDLSAAALDQDRLDQSLAVRANDQTKTRLDLLARLDDLGAQRRVKGLQLAALRAGTARDRQLHERGMLSAEVVAQSELAEAQAAVELERLTAEEEHARQSNRATLHGLDLEMVTLRRERAEARRLLELGTTRADRAGVVTWAVTEEGAAVHKGDVLARVADLRSFRVDATVSDVHAQRLARGQAVIVKISESASLAGTIATVNPTIRDGVVTFSVALAERSSPLLRSNLRVDALVVTSRKERVRRVARGPFAEAGGVRDLFVVRGRQAVRTRVQLGLAGAEHLEIVDGLAPGDEVIISDMSDYLSLRELAIR